MVYNFVLYKNHATINFRYSIEFLYQVVAQFDYLNRVIFICVESSRRAFIVGVDFTVFRAEIGTNTSINYFLESGFRYSVKQSPFPIFIWIGIIVYHYSGGNSECYKICFHNSITLI